MAKGIDTEGKARCRYCGQLKWKKHFTILDKPGEHIGVCVSCELDIAKKTPRMGSVKNET